MSEKRPTSVGLVEKTVQLNPTLRRALRSQGSRLLPSDPLFGPRDEAHFDCTYCWGTCLVRGSDVGDWVVCPQCRNDLLVMHVVEVDGGWFVSRDQEGVWGRGECLIEAVLDADRKADDSDSIWALRFQAPTPSYRRVHLSVGHDVWRLVIDQCNEMGLTTDEFLAEAAVSSSTATLMRSKKPVAEAVDARLPTKEPEAMGEEKLTVTPEAAVVGDVRERAERAQG